MQPSWTGDVLIIGGGVVGAATAVALAQRVRRVALLDQFEPPHERGSSHGDGRIVRYAYPDAMYVALAGYAYPLWRALSERAADQLTQTTGGWDCVPAGSVIQAQIEASLQRFDVPYHLLDSAESNQRFPQFRIGPEHAAIYQPQGGLPFADRTVRALWRLARADGVTTVTGDAVRALDPLGERVQVRTTGGRRYVADRVVLAAGTWSAGLLRHLGVDLPLTPLQVTVAHFPFDGAVRHDVGAMPTFIDYSEPLPFYGLPQIDVPGVKVGWHTHGVPLADADVEGVPDDVTLPGIRAFVKRRLPYLSPQPAAVLRCRYMMTPDEHFVVDHVPGMPQIIVGTGFSGHGFKFAPALGEILADLAVDATPAVPIDGFACDRFATL